MGNPPRSMPRMFVSGLAQAFGLKPLDKPKPWVLICWEWNEDRHCWYLVIRIPMWMLPKALPEG